MTRVLVSNLRLLKELELLLGLVPEGRIVLLKGAGLVAAGLRDPRERGMEDADLLVRPADLGSVRRALSELGFAKRPGTPGDFLKDGLVFDVQTGVWYLSSAELDRFMDRAAAATLGSAACRVPAALDHLVFIIAHAAAHHAMVDPRWVEDCRALVQAHPDETAPEALAKRLAELGLENAGAWFDERSGLGLLGPWQARALDRPGWDLLADWGGEHRGHFLRLTRLHGWRARGRLILRQAFPPAEVVRARYDLQSPAAVALWQALRPLTLLGRGFWALGSLAASAGRRWSLKLPPKDAIAGQQAFRQVYEAAEEARLEGPPAWEPWEQALLRGPLAGKGSGRLLDIGCGAGREAILFSGLGFRVTAMDPSPAMVEAARASTSRARVSCDISCADPETAEFPERIFDVVYLTRVLFSLYIGRDRRSALLRKFRSWLKPGGLLLLCVYQRPAREGSATALARRFRSLAGRLLGRHPWEEGDTWMRVGPEPADMAVFHRFGPAELAGELLEAGLKPEQGPSAGCWLGLRTGA